MDKGETLVALPTREVWLHERPRISRLRATLRFAAAVLMLVAGWSLFTCLMNHHARLPAPWSGDRSTASGGHSSLCGSERHSLTSKAFPLTTGPDKDVTIIQKLGHHHGDHYGPPPHVSGTIDVRTGPEPRITLDVTGTDKDLDIHVSFHHGSQELVIATPRTTSSGYTYTCIEVKAVVYLPEGAELTRLSLHAQSLDLSLLGGLDLKLDSAVVKSVSGRVHVLEGALAAVRTVELTTISGGIDSEVPVAEVIRVTTTSGDISLVLLPVSDLSFSRCSLTVASVSGDIDIRTRGVPAQVSFSHKVTSVSGSITLSLPFTDADLRSTSGEITATLTPVFTDSGTSLRTKSLSGDSDLTVKEPAEGGRLDLDSQHDATSGDLKIRYPQAWEGEFAAQSRVGDVSVEGRDVEVRKVTRGVEGRKGDGGSKMRAKSFSGDIEVIIGQK